MEAVSHSPFLQALGFALVNCLWQFALLWFAYIMLDSMARLSSHQKYCAAITMQFAGFIWFIITFFFYFGSSSTFKSVSTTPTLDYSIYDTFRENFLIIISNAGQLLSFLSIAYLCLLVFLIAKLFKAYRYTQSVKNTGLRKIDVNWRIFVQKLSAQLGIKQQVKIYLSEKIKTPLTIGFIKPLILIPLASINHLQSDQLEAIILHELAHIKRFDYIFNLLLTLIETVLFFNPFTNLLGRYIKRERENCCDDWVLQFEYNAASYARALLHIATCQTPTFKLALKATDNKKALLERIKRMIGKKEENFFNYRLQVVALFIMTTILSSVALLSSNSNLQKNLIAFSIEKQSEPTIDFTISKNLFDLSSFSKIAHEKAMSADRVTSDISTGNMAAEQQQRMLQRSSPIVSVIAPKELLHHDDEVMVASPDEDVAAHIAKKDAETFKLQAIAEQIRLENVTTHPVDKAMEKDQALQSLAVVLDRLKSIKLKLELTKLSNSVTPEAISILTQSLATIPATNAYSQADFNLLISQIKTELKEVKEQYNLLPKIDDNEVTINFSDDNNSGPQPPEDPGYSFSYGFSEKPAKKREISTSKNTRRNKNKDQEISEIIPVLPTPEPPPAPAKKTFTIRKNYFIVKI